jgi:N-acetylmuramoyl-L-alanine amidase
MLLDAPVKYEAYRLQGPERIYFDVHGIRLTPDLAHNPTLTAEGALLSRIRVSQFDADTVRVVLDLKGAYRYSALLLANPPRLLVEIFDKVQPPPQPPHPSGAALPAARDHVAGALNGFRIVIDPGHGGNDLGTVSRRGLEEKQLALDIARRLSSLLQKNGAEVTLTRADDRFIPLEARTQTANQAHADLFVSIHGNSSEDRAAAGIETYFFSGAMPEGRSAPGGGLTEAAALDREDRRFAGDVQKALYGELAKTGPLRNRGVRTAPLVVLRGAAMPAILVEISFLSSPAEEPKLHSPEYRQQIAAALCRGIVRHAASMQRAPQVVAKSGK